MNHKNQISDTYPLFDTFWNNTGLRGTVFPNRTELQAKTDFVSMINDLNSILYSFINIK